MEGKENDKGEGKRKGSEVPMQLDHICPGWLRCTRIKIRIRIRIRIKVQHRFHPYEFWVWLHWCEYPNSLLIAPLLWPKLRT